MPFQKGHNLNTKPENKIIYQDDKIIKFSIKSKKYGNFEIIIDAQKWNKIKKYRWHIKKNTQSNTYYVATIGRTNTNESRKTIRLHRFITNCEDSNIICDHKNRNPLDNRLKNIRFGNRINNGINVSLRKDNSSGYKGVHWHKQSNKWRVQINIKGKRTHIGMFTNVINAALAYNEVAKKYFGEFAYLNEV